MALLSMGSILGFICLCRRWIEPLTDLSEKEKKITELKANVAQLSFQNAHQQIVSPVDEYIHELYIHTVGGVVTPAEKLVSIVPSNTPLKIQSLVEDKDIGYVKLGMPVIQWIPLIFRMTVPSKARSVKSPKIAM
jgi:multidrug resistance efflux pump